MIQYWIQDTLCELLLLTNEFIMAVVTIFQILYVNNFSLPLNWKRQLIHYLISKTLCKLLFFSNSRYSVWMTSPHHWNDKDTWSKIWFQTPCVNYFSHFELVKTLNPIPYSRYPLKTTLLLLSDSRYSVWPTSPHHWIDKDSWYNIWFKILSVNYFSLLN